jgi:hypothetical protein
MSVKQIHSRLLIWLLQGGMLAAFHSCTLDQNPLLPQNVLDSTCINLPPPSSSWGWNQVFPEYSEIEFSFNPQNSHEFVIHKYLGRPGGDTLFKYDILSGQRTTVTTTLTGTPYWGNKGWIIMWRGGLTMVKANGDSLKILPCTGICSRPGWNPAGDHYYFLRAGVGPGAYFIADLDGTITDTIVGIIPRHWYAEDAIIGVNSIPGTNQEGLYDYHPSTKQKELLMPVPKDSNSFGRGLASVQVFPDHQTLAFLGYDGLFIGAKGMTKARQIFQSCDNHRMEVMQVAPDGQTILATVTKYEQIGPDALTISYMTILIDPASGLVLDTLFASPPH